jgi:hypothetical protein
VAALARVDEIEASRLASGLDDAFALVAGRFRRREVRVRARACVAGMLSGLERKTGWSLAEHAGEARPDGMQRQYTGYVTLAMLALAWLAVTRAALAVRPAPGQATGGATASADAVPQACALPASGGFTKVPLPWTVVTALAI